ncbi:MAG: RND family transporter [Candidatus Pelagadaptatus aseana]|uniref:efflux RND transporter permease subunit n=1 Tax=Candidatus Pelagadaptatus aseana TaxID=3120508 RepID=UPI0039B1D745
MSVFEKLVSLYQQLVIQRPKLALSLVAVTVLAFAAGLPNFRLDASADSLTLETDTDLDYFREVNKRYQSGDFLVITFKPHDELFSDDSIELMQALVADLSQVDGVTSTLSMLDAPLLYSPKVSLTEITEPRTLLTEGVDWQDAKSEFLESPIYEEMILGPDGQTTAIMLNLRVDEDYIRMVRHRDSLRAKRNQHGLTAAEQQELDRVSKEFLDYRTALSDRDHLRVEEVRRIVASYRDRAELFVGGATMITSDMLSFIEHDLKVFGIAILVFMVAIMALIFRQKRFVVLPLLTCFSAVIIMLGGLAWVDWRLTVISSNFVSLLLIISLAITIHLVVRYREYHAATPDAPQSELVMNTVRFMARPCLYTTLTTMVAFISLVVSDIRPVIDFGWMMSMGLALALVLAFIIIPAGLMVLPKGEPKDKGDNSHVFTLKFAWFIEKHHALVLWLSLLAALVSAYGISKLEVENRFIDYFHSSTEIYQGMETIDKNLGGTITLDITLDAQELSDGFDYAAEGVADEDDPFGEADPFDEPDPFAEADPFGEADPFSEQNPEAKAKDSVWFTVSGLEQVKRIHDYLDTLPEVGKVQSLATAYKVGNDVNGARLNNFELALMKKSLPPEINDVLVAPYLSEEYNQTRITMRVKETDPDLKRMELLQRIHHQIVNELGFAEEQVKLSGLLVLYNNMLQSLFTSQIVTLGAVFLGILLMFMVLFRSLSLSLVAIVPNLLAAAVVLGGMGLFGVPLDMMTITIAAITVGIGVDDTIHYIHRFKKEFVIDHDYVEAMHRSHASIGRAMFYTSVIIVVGFSILALSNFIPSIYFGLLTGLAMVAAILGALTLLPRLILLFKPLGPGKVPEELQHV